MGDQPLSYKGSQFNTLAIKASVKMVEHHRTFSRIFTVSLARNPKDDFVGILAHIETLN
jgi:hypothetical protein